MKMLSYIVALLLPVLAFGQMESEPNGSFSTPTPIIFGQTLEGKIGESGDEDYFELPVTEPGIIKVTISGVPGVDYRSFLYLPNRATQIFRRAQTAENTALIYEVSTCSTESHFLYFSDEFGIGGNQGTGFNPNDSYFLTVEFTPFAGIDDCECENETLFQACEVETGITNTALIAPYFSRIDNQSRHDFDTYKFTIPIPSIARVTIIDLPANVGLDAEFYASDRATKLLSRNGSDGVSYSFEISVCEVGEYYLLLQDNRDGGTRRFNAETPYRFRIDLLPFAGVDNCECENETISQACEITDGELVSALVGPFVNFETGQRDRDAYFLDVVEPSFMSVDVINIPTNIDLNLKITGPDQVETLFEQDRTTAYGIDLSLCEPGRYYFEFEDRTIFNTNFNSEEPYTFRVSLRPISEVDEWECNNNTFNTAREISLCDTIRAVIGPRFTYEEAEYDEDYYSIELESNTAYRVLLNNIPSNLDNMRVYVYNANQVEVDRLFPGNGGSINNFYTPPTSGRYYFRVFDNRSQYNIEELYQLQIGCNQTTSATLVAGLSAIALYPNPAANQFTLDLSEYSITSGQLSLLNASGQRVLNQQVNVSQTTVDISNLPKGLYFVEFTSAEQKMIGRLVRK